MSFVELLSRVLKKDGRNGVLCEHLHLLGVDDFVRSEACDCAECTEEPPTAAHQVMMQKQATERALDVWAAVCDGVF